MGLKKETLVEERRFESAAAITNLPPPMEFYLLLLEDKRPARFKTIAEVREQIEKAMVAEERTRLEKQGRILHSDWARYTAGEERFVTCLRYL